MNTPPMLVGAGLLFWGWQTGLLPVSIALAAILESSRLVKHRWQFSPADLRRIWNLSALLFVGAVVLAVLSDQGMGLLEAAPRANTPAARVAALNKTARAALLFGQWLPLVFFPLAAAQAFGPGGGMRIGLMQWLLGGRAGERGLESEEVNVSFPYLALSVLGASASAQRAPTFFGGMALLLAWALWSRRVRRFTGVQAGAAIVLVCAGAYAGAQGIRELQRIATDLDTAFLSRFSRRDFNPREHRSLLGAVGRVKGSGRIVLWVKTDGGAPPLLREATYDQFTAPVWHVTNRDFNNALPENDQTTWKLVERESNEPQVEVRNSNFKVVCISRLLRGGRGLLPAPNGTAELRQLPIFVLQTNMMAVLKSDGGPGFVAYEALYDPGAGNDSAPTVEDLKVPLRESAVIATIAQQLNLPALASEDPALAVETVESYFQRDFSYSTWLEGDGRKNAVARFLLETRKGHCEYFASATVLLLRQAGIPARYAVGYSVQEGRRGKYVVRERHAHAWALAYIGGAWTDVDTTPASWNLLESQRASWWEPASDIWAKLILAVSRLRWSGPQYRTYLMWSFVPAIVGLGFVIYRRRQWTRARVPATSVRNAPGMDSEFYLVEKRLQELGFARDMGESMLAWLARLNGAAPHNGVALEELLRLHYQYRFDPDGLAESERENLKTKSEVWLASASQHGSVQRDQFS